MANNGITYFNRTPIYPGDVDKHSVGLRSSEIDSNFFFLRGKDIEYGCWSGDTLLLKTVSGEEVPISGVPDCVVSLSGSTYDADNGILTISANGSTIEISGFTTCSCIDCSGITEVIEEILRRLKAHDDTLLEIERDIENLETRISELRDAIYADLHELESRLNYDECRYDQFSAYTITEIERLKHSIAGSGITDVVVNGVSVVNEDNVAVIDLTGYATVVQITYLQSQITKIENRLHISGNDVEPIGG